MSQYSKSKLRSPLGRVRGLGSAKSGAHHWWMERMSALALIPLTVWFVISLVTHLLGATPEQLAEWLASPPVALAMAALIIIGFYHSKMGVQVIVEDYVHCESKKFILLILLGAAHYILMAASLFAILRLHFGI